MANRTYALSSITTTPQAITCHEDGIMLITVEEDSTLTPVGLKKRAPLSTDTAKTYAPGVGVPFIARPGGFKKDEIVGYIETQSSTSSGFQEES